ncbi:MAG: hypothetical protein KGK11_06625 [Sphingomonadales bacterium]|nr:hypothetical protein [Sphingomonadales bacterium]
MNANRRPRPAHRPNARGCLAAAGLAALLAGCASTPPVPRPAPAIPAAAPAPPSTANPPPPTAWQDRPATPGVWRWQQQGLTSLARFDPDGGAPRFTLACNPVAQNLTLTLFVSATGDAPLTLATTAMTRTLAATAGADGSLHASIAARDPLLDAIAFSRGHFALLAEGVALYPPSWPEVARAIEDCR